MPDPLSWTLDELEGLRGQQLIRVHRKVTPLGDGWVEIDGRRLRNFASNDYLNLAQDPRLVEAARAALDEYGVGSGASPLVTGRTDWHARLEERLARFEGQDAAVLFPTGYAANIGTISALVGGQDVVFCDRLNHASLIDGCRLSGARLRVYRHRDLHRLQRELERSAGFRRRLVVTDSLFSMDGDFAPLPELCELAERYDAAILVDEAHATGLFGEHGRGVAELMRVEDRITVRIGTLSKAIGTLGGFVSGPRALVDWLWNRARTQMFSTALPPAVCAAACRAVEIIEAEPWRRRRLLDLSQALRLRLSEAGVEFVPAAGGPIVPVILNDPAAAVRAASQLQERGFFVAAIRPPTVPAGTSRLRITVTSAHTEEDIDRLVGSLSESA